MNRQEALAISFANLKGPREKELIRTAAALDYLKGLPEFGSNVAVGRAVGVSGEIVREFLSLLQLPREVQEFLQRRELSLEQGRRLSQLARIRPEAVIEAARAMTDLTVMDSRHLADYLCKFEDVTVLEAVERVRASKTVRKREFHVIARLGDQEYRELKRCASRQGEPVDELVTEIVTAWLKERENDA